MNRRQRKAAKRLANIGTQASLFDQLAALGPAPDYDDAHTVEQAAAVARRRVAWQEQRATIIATHRKRSKISDVAVLQELHSPTVEISTDDPEGKKRARANVTRVRQSQAWRHNVLSAMQRQAEVEMATAYQARTVGLGVASLDMLAVRGAASDGAGLTARAAALDEAWREFVNECQRERIHFGLVLVVLVEPRTLGEIDAGFRLKPGRAMAEYLRGLDLWARLRGWR